MLNLRFTTASEFKGKKGLLGAGRNFRYHLGDVSSASCLRPSLLNLTSKLRRYPRHGSLAIKADRSFVHAFGIKTEESDETVVFNGTANFRGKKEQFLFIRILIVEVDEMPNSTVFNLAVEYMNFDSIVKVPKLTSTCQLRNPSSSHRKMKRTVRQETSETTSSL